MNQEQPHRARTPADEPAARGRQVFRAQCASCHTIDGYQGIRELLPEDSDMTLGVLFAMYEQGQAFTELERGQSVDKSGLDYPFMPPFVGTDEELEAAALQFVRKLSGFNAPSKANEAAFDQAVDQVAGIARDLLDALVTKAPPRDRDIEAAKARLRTTQRFG